MGYAPPRVYNFRKEEVSAKPTSYYYSAGPTTEVLTENTEAVLETLIDDKEVLISKDLIKDDETLIPVTFLKKDDSKDDLNKYVKKTKNKV